MAVDATLADTVKIRTEVEKLLIGVDLGGTSIGALRGRLEQALKLPAGALEPRKEQVNAFITEAIIANREKKRKAEEDKKKEPAHKKEKKDKKAKKEKDKSKDEGGGEALPGVQAAQAPSPPAPAPAPPAPEAPPKPEILEDMEEAEATLPAEAPVVLAPPPATSASLTAEPSPPAAVTSELKQVASAGASLAAEGEAAAAVPAGEQDAMFADFTDEALDATAGRADGIDMPAALSTDGRWVVTGGEDGSVRLWNLEESSCARVLEGHRGTIHAVTVDWPNLRALCGASDGCRLWDLRRGACMRTMSAASEGCLSLAANFSAAGSSWGQALGGCADGSLQVWDLTTGESKSSVASAHPGGVWALDVAWERKRAASGGDASFKVWDMEDWTCLQLVEGQPGGIMSLAVAWAENHLLVGCGSLGASGRNLRFCELRGAGGNTQVLQGCQDVVSHVWANWDENVAVTGSWDARIKLWCLEKRLCTLTHVCDFGRVRAMAVDAGKTALCGSSSGVLHLVDLRTGKVLQSLEGHVGALTAVCAKF